MSKVSALHNTIKCIVCISLAIPSTVHATEPVFTVKGSTKQPVFDIVLSPDARLTGNLVDTQGQGIPNFQIKLSAMDSVRPHDKFAVTDINGNFTINGIGGGVYVLATEKSAIICRLWVHGSAPPVAKESVLVVIDQEIVRGQIFMDRSFYEIIEPHPLCWYSIIATTVMLPIVFLGDDNDGEGS